MSRVRVSDGPIVVTGASGFIGSHIVAALVRRGYEIRACVTDRGNVERTAHLLALNEGDDVGRVELHEANLLVEGSYDAAVSGCVAVFHAGTPMSHHGNSNREVYEGALSGARNVLSSVQRAGSVQRLIYTSSMAAISHPAAEGYRFTEEDWAYASPWYVAPPDTPLPAWDEAGMESDLFVAYGMAKVATERLVFAAAAEDGHFDAMSVQPAFALGPLLSPLHNMEGSWQMILGKMLEGEQCVRAWWRRWNVVDVRDVGEAHARIAESDISHNGDRYQITATDGSGELSVLELQAHLQRLFPSYDVAGAPSAYYDFLERRGGSLPAYHAYCTKARRDLGLETHAIEDTLYETGRTLIDLGLVKPALAAS